MTKIHSIALMVHEIVLITNRKPSKSQNPNNILFQIQTSSNALQTTIPVTETRKTRQDSDLKEQFRYKDSPLPFWAHQALVHNMQLSLQSPEQTLETKTIPSFFFSHIFPIQKVLDTVHYVIVKMEFKKL